MKMFPSVFSRRVNRDPGRFGYAVVGLGHGAEKMCEALRESPHARVAALVSSSHEKAERFARKFARHLDSPKLYTYDEFALLASDAAVHAAYLALPVMPHRDFTERAATAGKHVLCEKPMAASGEDAEAMIHACARSQRLLMIAYRLDYDPMHDELRKLLGGGVLGRLLRVRSAFGIVAKAGWRFDPKLAGGGSLFDVGVYPIHALHNFFGEVRIERAEIRRDPATGIEVDARWEGSLEGGAAFTCHSSYVERDADSLTVEGERGTVTLHHAYAYERTELEAEWRDASGAMHRLRLRDARTNPSLFRLEAEHLAHCARSGDPLRSPGAAGLRDLQTIARIEALGRS